MDRDTLSNTAEQYNHWLPLAVSINRFLATLQTVCMCGVINIFNTSQRMPQLKPITQNNRADHVSQRIIAQKKIYKVTCTLVNFWNTQIGGFIELYLQSLHIREI